MGSHTATLEAGEGVKVARHFEPLNQHIKKRLLLFVNWKNKQIKINRGALALWTVFAPKEREWEDAGKG